ncbi:hypothetical protein KAW38_00865 [Candidatus Micrarchaeota archaeon]|nr:hypothetical protein [Candidatus Micrarchaeota archaeon]
MKTTFIFFLFLTLVFSYSEPPVNETIIHNTQLASSLMDYSGAVLSSNCWDDWNTEGEEVCIGAAISLIKPIPTVDNFTSQNPIGFLWMWGSSYPVSASAGEHSSCEEVTLMFLDTSHSGNATFIFENMSKTVSLDFDEGIIQIPFPLDGNTTNITLTVLLNATLRFNYLKLSDYMDGPFCKQATSQVFFDVKLSDVSSSYYVESGEPLFFTLRPVLKEQWYKNNKFDNLAFSRKRFYKAEVFLDNESIYKQNLYNFTIENDSYEVWYVHSHKLNNSEFLEVKEQNNASSLSTLNRTYFYSYFLNSTYNATGLHSVQLILYSLFAEEHNLTVPIKSRKLTAYNSLSETGEEKGDEDSYRPSVPMLSFSELKMVYLEGGMLALFLIVSLVWVGVKIRSR